MSDYYREEPREEIRVEPGPWHVDVLNLVCGKERTVPLFRLNGPAPFSGFIANEDQAIAVAAELNRLSALTAEVTEPER
jgi:hypothetical protein